MRLRNHVRDHRLSTVEDAFDVDGKHRVKVLLCHLLENLAIFGLHELCITNDTRIVDQNIKAPSRLDEFCDSGIYLGALGDVDLLEVPLDFAGNRSACSFVKVPHKDLRARFRKGYCGRLANSSAASGHHSNLTPQIDLHHRRFNSQAS